MIDFGKVILGSSGGWAGFDILKVLDTPCRMGQKANSSLLQPAIRAAQSRLWSLFLEHISPTVVRPLGSLFYAALCSWETDEVLLASVAGSGEG